MSIHNIQFPTSTVSAPPDLDYNLLLNTYILMYYYVRIEFLKNLIENKEMRSLKKWGNRYLYKQRVTMARE